MAKFSPPFSNDIETRRLPTVTERQTGFPCGPADRTLFGGLFNRIESELGEVISYAGLTPTDDRMTQLREAIVALIAAASGSGPSVDYILLQQARARLPIHFDIQTVDGKIPVVSPAVGTVRLPGGVNFQHRGIFPVTTVQTDFPTVASKTYHLRWNPTAGFTLKDLADVAYNVGAAAETSTLFDSTYDDMLVSRIVTNASNIATITNLWNAPTMAVSGEVVNPRGAFKTGGEGAGFQNNVGPSGIVNYDTLTLNWARTPFTYLTALNDVRSESLPEKEFSAGIRPLSRYAAAVWGLGDVDIWVGWAARV